MDRFVKRLKENGIEVAVQLNKNSVSVALYSLKTNNYIGAIDAPSAEEAFAELLSKLAEFKENALSSQERLSHL